MSDSLTNAYSLIIRRNNSFQIRINDKLVKSGSLLTDFEPPVNPPYLIDDPTDSRPPDWDDRQFVINETASQPPDWNESEPEFIDDPAHLVPPEGWLIDEPLFIEDPKSKPAKHRKSKKKPRMIPNPKCLGAIGCGPYTPPRVRNPKYRGPYVPPQVPNPNYSGAWKPRQIVNPGYVVDRHPHKLAPVYALGLDVWTIDGGVGFNNIVITTDEKHIRQWNQRHSIPKRADQEERPMREMAQLPSKPRTEREEDVEEIIADLADGIVEFIYRFPVITVLIILLIFKGPRWLFGLICCCRRNKKSVVEEPKEVKDISDAEKTELRNHIRNRRKSERAITVP
jgi:calnexin